MNYLQKIWVCGCEGRVGRELVSLLNKTEAELLLTDVEAVDITDVEAVIDYANINRPHFIVNCAGFTDVLACENQVEMAFKVNALGPRNLSVAARKVRARVVQLSTDDVFDGASKTPYTEFDTPNPQTIYGKSKLAGEEFIKEFSKKHIIIRSSWIFGDGNGYLKQILEQVGQGKEVYAATDQIASPTGARSLARQVLYLMEYAQDGIYHVTSEGSCSRYEFAKEVLRLIGAKSEVIPVSAKEDTLALLRPSYSVLDNLMLRISDLPMLSGWQGMLEEYLREKGYCK